MADNFLPYQNPSVTDSKLDTESLDVGAHTVHRERIQVAGTGATDIAPVSATDGLLVNLGANNDVTVSGVATSAKQDLLLTELQLKADLTETQPVSVASLPLPTGASTSANQTTVIGHLDGVEGLLTTIDADTSNLSTKIDTLAGAVAGTEMQVDVLSSALPTGAATSAKQDTGNTSVASIDTKTPALGQALAAASVPVILPAATITTLTPPAAITGFATSAKQDTIIGHVDGIETLIGTTNTTLTTIDGRVDGIETLIGTTNTTLTTIDGRVDGLEASNSAIQTSVQLLDDAVQVLGTDTYTEASSKGITLGAVRRDADTTLVNTTNEFAPLQLDARGFLKVEAFSGETLPVSLTSTTITGTVAVTQSGTWDEVGINDSGNSITVDAPVGTPVFVRLSDGASAISTLPVSLASVPSHAVTNAGTFVVQENGAALTALQLIDNAVSGSGFNITQLGGVNVSMNTGVRDSGTQRVTIATNDSVPVTGTFWQATQPVSIAALPASTNTIEVVGDVAEDVALSGNPVRLGGRASAAEPTAMSADGRIVTPWMDRRGRQVVTMQAATGTQTSVASSATNVTLLASNTSRKGVILFNDSTQICYVRYAATATSSNYTLKMHPDDYHEVPFGYTGIIDGIWASANGSMRVTEIT